MKRWIQALVIVGFLSVLLSHVIAAQSIPLATSESPQKVFAPWTDPAPLFGLSKELIRRQYPGVVPVYDQDTLLAYPWGMADMPMVIWYKFVEDKLGMITFVPQYRDVSSITIWHRIAVLMDALAQLYGPPTVLANEGAQWNTDTVTVTHTFAIGGDAPQHVVRYLTTDSAILAALKAEAEAASNESASPPEDTPQEKEDK